MTNTYDQEVEDLRKMIFNMKYIRAYSLEGLLKRRGVTSDDVESPTEAVGKNVHL